MKAIVACSCDLQERNLRCEYGSAFPSRIFEYHKRTDVQLHIFYSKFTENLPNPMFGKTVYRPHFIYRGHSSCQYKLLPAIFRWHDLPQGVSVSAYSQLEFNILEDFISEACFFVRDVPVDDVISWLEIAQHFGVPTRLLDFTENPLVALYFACIGSPEKDACVWIINDMKTPRLIQFNYFSADFAA